MGRIRKMAKDDLLLQIFAYMLLIAMIIVFLFPIINVISLSFSGRQYVERRDVLLWPLGFNLDSYRMIFEHQYVIGSFFNSVIYTFVGTLYSLTLTVFGAYALAHKRLRFRSLITLLIAFTMLFSGGLIPTFLLVRDLGFLDKMWALIIPLAISPWNLIVMRTVFQQNPDSLEESAKIDGAGYFRILFRIIIPISLPVIATIGLFYTVDKWNDFFNALVYLSTKSKFPLQLIAREILVTFSDQSLNRIVNAADADRMNFTPMTFRAALIVISITPLMLVYPFLQKYFVKGVMIGAIKG